MKTAISPIILLIDDHATFRAGLLSLLKESLPRGVYLQAGSVLEAMEILETQTVDIALVDIAMPELNGLQFLALSKQKYPRLKTLFLSAHKNPEYCKYVMSHGASGFIPKEDAFEWVLKGVQTVLAGKKYVSPTIEKFIVSQYLEASPDGKLAYPDILTRTEVAVLRHLAAGASTKEMSDALKVSPRTVETHRAHILKKLHSKNTAQLVQYAVVYGLIKLPSTQDT